MTTSRIAAHVANKTSVPDHEPSVPDQELGAASGLEIQGSVGNGGENDPRDVETIQQALNRVPPGHGGPLPPLEVDGLIGPKTVGAIYGFQKHQFGAAGADGRVDPGHRTLAKLNEFQTQAQPAPTAPSERGNVLGLASFSSTSALTSSPDVIMDRVRSNQIALGSILAAKRRLAEATAFAQGTKTKDFELAEKVVQRCFKIRDAGRFARDTVNAMQKIDKIYDLMLRVLAEKQTIFQPMTGSRCVTLSRGPKNAFAFVGGFHRPKTEMSGGSPSIPVRGIYFCTANISTMVPERVADLIVHEMAHFVGPAPGAPGAIGHAAGGGQAALRGTHPDMMVTAANYAWLAWLSRLPKSRWLTDPG